MKLSPIICEVHTRTIGSNLIKLALWEKLGSKHHKIKTIKNRQMNRNEYIHNS